MESQAHPKPGIRFIVLALFLYVLYAIDLSNSTWSTTAVETPFALLVMAILKTAVLSLTLLRCRDSGWKLV